MKDGNSLLEKQILERSDQLAWERTKNEWLNAELEASKQEEIHQRHAQEQRQRKEQAERDYKELNRLISRQRGELHSLARERNNLNRQEFGRLEEHLNTYERLKMVAENIDCSVSCFPSEWADVSDDILKTIHPDLRNALLKRTESKRKGLWRRFYVRLRDIQM